MEAASLWAGVRFTARNGSPEALLTDAAGQGLHLYGISSLPGLHSLSGDYQHGAAGKICTQYRPITLCPQPVQGACGDLRPGMGRGNFYRKPAFFKIQACPRELAAFQQGIFSGAQQLLGYGSAGLQAAAAQNRTRPRLLPGGQAAVVHRPYKSLQPDQHQPPSDKPCPKPLAPQQRAQ